MSATPICTDAAAGAVRGAVNIDEAGAKPAEAETSDSMA